MKQNSQQASSLISQEELEQYLKGSKPGQKWVFSPLEHEKKLRQIIKEIVKEIVKEELSKAIKENRL